LKTGAFGTLEGAARYARDWLKVKRKAFTTEDTEVHRGKRKATLDLRDTANRATTGLNGFDFLCGPLCPLW
jgi:hypothetical protein